MKYLEIKEDDKYILSDETACMNVQYIHRLSEVCVEDKKSNQIANARRLTYIKRRNDSVVMFAYIGDGYIEYLTNTMYISWDKVRNGEWRMGGNNICLYLNNGGNQDIENILVIEAVYGVCDGTDESFGFEVFDAYGKLIFKLNDNLIRIESANNVSIGYRPYSKAENFTENTEAGINISVDDKRLLLVQENFNHLSATTERGSSKHGYYAIKQSKKACELSLVQEEQAHYVGESYGFGSASAYIQLNAFSISNTCVDAKLN